MLSTLLGFNDKKIVEKLKISKEFINEKKIEELRNFLKNGNWIKEENETKQYRMNRGSKSESNGKYEFLKNKTNFIGKESGFWKLSINSLNNLKKKLNQNEIEEFKQIETIVKRIPILLGISPDLILFNNTKENKNNKILFPDSCVEIKTKCNYKKVFFFLNF